MQSISLPSLDVKSITDALLYVEAPEFIAHVLRAVILELKCSKCDMQDRWRGRSHEAVDKVAHLRGWTFDECDALCPQHSGIVAVTYRKIRRKFIAGICTYGKCAEPITDLPKKPRGRPSNKCTKHHLQFQRYALNQKNASRH